MINSQFDANLERAYRSLEKKFNRFRTPENLDFCRRNGSSWYDDLLTPILLPISTPSDGTVNQRVVVLLDEGYAAKTRPKGCIRGRFHYVVCNPEDLRTRDSNHADFQEERNVVILKKYGFIKERGFYVPEHRVVGLTIEGGAIKVNPNGIDFTITEDVSEAGNYEVSDVKPYHFVALDNERELLDSYKRHIDALLGLYHDPRIIATIKRHGKPSNPLEPISRMLLVRTKDNVGEIVIADLDNISFEEA